MDTSLPTLPYCLCKEEIDPVEFRSRLKLHDLASTGWICLTQNCDFSCSSLEEISKHGEAEQHDPLSNAVFVGEFDFKDAQDIVSNGSYKDYSFIQEMNSGEAFGIRCLCGKGVLALFVNSASDKPNGLQKDSEKNYSHLPTLSLNSYLKSVRNRAHSNGNDPRLASEAPSQRKQLIDKCSVCLKVLQLYRSDSDTLATQKLRNHALTHLPKYWLCTLCDQRFQRRNDVISHMDKRHQAKETNPLCALPKGEWDEIVEGMLNQCFPDLQTMPVNRKLIKGNEFSHKELPEGTSIADLNRPFALNGDSHSHNNSATSVISRNKSFIIPPVSHRSMARPDIPVISAQPGELTACALCSKKLQLAYRGAVRHVTRMKNHALTHMDACWMCPVCEIKMHRRSDLANHLGRHEVEPDEEVSEPVLTIDENEFQRILSETIELCFPEGGTNTLSKEQMDRIPVIESPKNKPFMKVRKKPAPAEKWNHKIRNPTEWPAKKESHLYAACDLCDRVLKLWKNRRHGIPWTGMANHALTHMKNYWYCSQCRNSYQRKDDAIKHAFKFHKKEKYARCSVDELKYQTIVRQTVLKCWLGVLKENPGETRSSNFKGMVVCGQGDISTPREDRDLLKQLEAGEKVNSDKDSVEGEESMDGDTMEIDESDPKLGYSMNGEVEENSEFEDQEPMGD